MSSIPAQPEHALQGRDDRPHKAGKNGAGEATSALSGPRSPWGPIGLLLIVMAAVKLLLLAMPPEAIAPQGYPDNEEWRRGMAAHEWLSGPLLPFQDYQQGNFQGGTLLTILLVALSYFGLGESPFTMRLPNLLFDGVTVAFVFLLVDRLVSRRAAWVAGLLAAIPSPGYAMVGAIVWAAHVEANAFAMALLWLWHRTVFRREAGLQPLSASLFRSEFLLGVLAGLAVWFHYGLLVWLAVMLLTEAARDWRAWVRPAMGIRVLGFLVGLGPWWSYNLNNEWRGLGVYGKSASAHFQTDAESVQVTFERLLTHFLPHSMYLPTWGGVGRVLEWAFYLIACVGWLVFAVQELRAWRRNGRPSALIPLVLYPPLWTVLYTFGTFHGQDYWVSGYRYMLPLHPIAWVATAIVLTRTTRRIELPFVAAATAVFLAGIASFLEPSALQSSLNGPGYHQASVARLMLMRHGENPEVLKKALDRCIELRAEEEAEIILFTLGNSLLYKAKDSKLPRWADESYEGELKRQREAHDETMRVLEAHLPERYKPYFKHLHGQPQRPWGWAQRDQFWKQWERLGQARPPGSYRD